MVSKFSPTQIDRVDLKGGLDLITPTLNLTSGYCRAAQNFECSVTGGYTRIAGYERYSGQAAPSAAGYDLMGLSTNAALSVGTVITGATSGAQATVCGLTNLGVTFNGVYFSSLTGAFVSTETVKKGVTVIGTVTYADPILGGTIGMSTTAGLSVGDTIVGQTSGAIGVISKFSVTLPVDNGVAYTNLTGVFQELENIKVGVTVVAFVDSINVTVTDPAQQATFTAAAADVYRALIGPVPGQGPVRGVIYLNNVVYAWRDAVGGAVCNVYKGTSSGWVQVPYAYMVPYTLGQGVMPTAGQTLTSSGASATIQVVVQQTLSPTWAGSQGYFLVTSPTGTFVNGNLLQVSAANVGTCGGPAVLIQPKAGGTYVFDKYNFGLNGSTITKAYGIDSENSAFEFDGTYYVPIYTGVTPVSADVPTMVAVHKAQLFLAYGASIQFSGIESPYDFTLLTGAGQFTLPAPMTDMLPLPGNQSTGALGVWTTTDTYVLYGTNGSTFALTNFNIGTGAIYNTASNMSDTYTLEMRGIMGLQTTLNYGNFDTNSLTMHIRPLIQQLRNSATCSIINREKSQYRVFFNNGYALYATMLNSNFIGVMPMLFPDPVLCVTEGSYTVVGEAEQTYFGTSTGYVMQLDSGTGFDGVAISAQITLVFDSEQTHRQNKRYRRVGLELSGGSYSPITVGYQLGYNKSTISQPGSASYAAPFQSVDWDNFYWDNFTWDGSSLSPTEVQLQGTAENIALSITSNTNYTQPYTINTASIHYSMRRTLRGS